MSGVTVIGVDAGGTKVLAGVVDDRLGVRYRSRRLWPVENSAEAVVDALVEAIVHAREAAPQAAAVGVGIPSLVDRRSGSSLFSSHLPLDGVDVRSLIEARVDLPVCVDNDANAAVLCEQRHGAARGCTDVVGLTLGTGIGGGVIVGGELYRGATGAAAELGHMVVDCDGPPCPSGCPNRGCLEAVASGRVIGTEGQAQARRKPESALGLALARGEAITGAHVTEMAKAGDTASKDVLELVGTRLGVGLANLINIFNPQALVVGGGVGTAGELLLGPARREVTRRALGPSAEAARVVCAQFGEDAGMIGAALMAFDKVMR